VFTVQPCPVSQTRAGTDGLAQERLATIKIAGGPRKLARFEEAPMAEGVVGRGRHPHGVPR
jgi:hypothetical protein